MGGSEPAFSWIWNMTTMRKFRMMRRGLPNQSWQLYSHHACIIFIYNYSPSTAVPIFWTQDGHLVNLDSNFETTVIVEVVLKCSEWHPYKIQCQLCERLAGPFSFLKMFALVWSYLVTYLLVWNGLFLFSLVYKGYLPMTLITWTQSTSL